MTPTIEARNDHTRIRVEGDFTIYEAAAVRDALLAALQRGLPITLDLDHVADMDSAALQLLVSARKSAAELGARLTLCCQSDPVLALVGLCNLRDTLLGPDSASLPDA